MTYSGEDRRSNHSDASRILSALYKIEDAIRPKRSFLGFKLQELVLIFMGLLGLLAFYLKTNDAIDRLVSLAARSENFITNSDAYHSAVTGYQFRLGAPNKYDYDIDRIRSAIKSPTRTGD